MMDVVGCAVLSLLIAAGIRWAFDKVCLNGSDDAEESCGVFSLFGLEFIML